MKHVPALLAGVILLGNLTGARGQSQITLIAPGGIRGAIEQLVPGFEAKTGHQVEATFGSGVGTPQQVPRGEPFDVPIVQSATPLAIVAPGVAVRKGCAQAGYFDPSGGQNYAADRERDFLPGRFARGGRGRELQRNSEATRHRRSIAAEDQLAQGGAGALAMVANDIGLAFLSEMDEPGIDVAGPLPSKISIPTSLVGFVSSHAYHPASAEALPQYLASPDAAAVYKAHVDANDRFAASVSWPAHVTLGGFAPSLLLQFHKDPY